eukprot:1093507-Karenia_brevis.AAC.1
MDAITISDHYNAQTHPYFPPPNEVAEETLDERIQVWKTWGTDVGLDDLNIAALSMEASVTGVPPFRMNINLLTNVDGGIKRLNTLPDEEYQM